MLEPNEEQQKIVDKAEEWFYHSSEQIYSIDGGAGTGKSFVLFLIVNRLNLRPDQILPMAYTGQAAVVMRKKGFLNSSSIHSALFKCVEVPLYKNGNIVMDTSINRPVMTFDFVPKMIGELSSNIRLMVIDEGYMVPLSFLPIILKHNIKVLVAGDQGQLPPIADDPAFLTGYNVNHLTQIMRQQSGNPIIYIANRARAGLPIHEGLYGNRVLVINEEELTNNMILNTGTIVCGTNKSRDIFNDKVRNLCGYSKYRLPIIGERVICRDNKWKIEQDGISLANGLTGLVVSQSNIYNINNNEYLFDFLPDMLESPFFSIHGDYKYLNSNYQDRNEMKNQEQYNKAIVRFEYAYALTTHLSQGAEFPSGIYYEEFLRSNIQKQLLYTGITRFKEYAIIAKHKRKFL